MTRSATVEWSGDVDVGTAPDHRRAALEALDTAGITQLRLDLGRVRFIDSTGLGALVAVRDAAEDRGVHLVLVGSSPALVRLLDLVGLTALFDVDPG